jgi:hypothetical protein
MTLLLKIVLAPTLVILATLAARRWGERAAGLLVALPVVAGPILLVVGLEHGAAFAARAAHGALLGIVAVAAFCVAFGLSARRSWPAAVLAGWSAYGLCALGLSRVHAALIPALLAGLAAIAIGRAVVRRLPEERTRAAPFSRPAWDLPARAVATAALVIAITSAASALGPTATGVLTPFPVATTVVVAFTLAQSGSAAARRVLTGYLTGLPGFAAFFVLVALVA